MSYFYYMQNLQNYNLKHDCRPHAIKYWQKPEKNEEKKEEEKVEESVMDMLSPPIA